MIIKSLIVFSLCLNLIGFNLSSINVDDKIASNYSKEEYQQARAVEIPLPLDDLANPVVYNPGQKSAINTRNYILVDGSTGTEISGREADARVPIASLTKIMTAVVTIENYSFSDRVTVPYEATIQTPTVVYLRTNEVISVSELLRCLMIKSGNDAAYSLAAHSDKENARIEKFVGLMNIKAMELDMDNTHFNDPAGLSDEGYSTASDLAKLTRYALLNPTFREIIKTPEYVAKNVDGTIFHQLENSNRLVTTFQYPGAIGVKTGFTYAASHCLVGAAQRNGHTLIAVVLGTYIDTPSASAEEARDLLDWGFANVGWES